MIRTGLIGFGMGGQVFHAPLINAVEGLELVKIRATKPDQIALASSRYPLATIVADNNAILSDASIDLAVITVPNPFHFSIAREALLAGKHVVVDKPFTVHSAEADALITLAKQQQKILTVYHNRRFDSDFRTIQKLVGKKWLGDIVELESRYDRFRNFLKPNAWREEDQAGSGILYDLGSHLIDQAVTLFDLPAFVSADIGKQRSGSKTDDCFELIFHYDNLKVILKAGMLVRVKLPRFVLMGRNGSFIKYGMDVQEEALKAGKDPRNEKDWGVEPLSLRGQINTDFEGRHIEEDIESEKGNYLDFYENVQQAISHNAALLVTPEQARNTIRLIELCIESNSRKMTLAFSNDKQPR